VRNRCRVGLCWCSPKKGVACRNGDAVNGDHESHCRLPGRTSLCYYTNIAAVSVRQLFFRKVECAPVRHVEAGFARYPVLVSETWVLITVERDLITCVASCLSYISISTRRSAQSEIEFRALPWWT
jgi:hypothetical protein